MWANECYNDIFDNGFQNNKLSLLYCVNKSAKFAIKTATGITERVDVHNIIMQGTVFGSIICASVVDKLAKNFYSNKNLLYLGVPDHPKVSPEPFSVT